MKKKIIYTAAAAVVLTASFLIIRGISDSSTVQYQFGTVTRGDIQNTVSATGTVSPVTTVEVGTQVSGTIDSVYVDYNEVVKAGQVLAVLDTTLLKATVIDAQAGLERSEAELTKAQSDYDRNKSLFDRSLISESDFLTYEVNLKSAQASVKSSTAALQRAERNLEYAVIRSPIKGIVIGKSVETGQTVAASLSTPTLFIIAQDLSHMEILADIDESDIGSIKEGQEVQFEVAAYLDKEFVGTVKQVRLQPQTVSNVVTYTAVVEAANDDGYLLPGMTATLEFITEKRTEVLIIPTKALRFEPSEAQLAALVTRREAEMKANGGTPPPPPDAMATSPIASNVQPNERLKDAGVVWYLDSLGQLKPAPLRIGISDGSNTEVVASGTLEEGMQVIIGEADGSSATASSTTTQRRAGGFGPPPGL